MRTAPLVGYRYLAGNRGSTLLYVIGALVVLGAIGAGIAVMSPSATQSKLEQEAGERAFYNAQSGLNFIMSMQGYYAANGTTVNNFINAMGGNNTLITYNVPGNGQFSYRLQLNATNGANGTYNVAYLLGRSADSSGNFKYSYLAYGGDRGSSDSYNYNANTGGASKYVLASYGSAVNVAGSAVITGDIYGQSFTSQQTNITGNIISQGNANLNFSTHVTGNLCAKGDVVLDQSSVTGSVNATGNVTMKFASSVTGSVYAGGYITMAESTTIGGSAHAQNYLTTGFSTNIGTSAYSNNDITFGGTAAQIAKDAYAGKSITLNWACSVGNQAVACDNVSVVYGSSVGSSLISCSYPPNVKPTAPSACTVTTSPKVASFTAGTTNITVGWGGTTYNTANPLAPGKYKKLTLSGASPLTLKAGTYYFSSIDIGYGSTLNLDVSGGDITIFVTGAVDVNATGGINVSTDGTTWKSMTAVDKSYAARVYLEAHSAIGLEWATNWFGTLFSTDSFSFAGDNTIIGSYVSTGSGTLSWAAKVTYVGSNYAAANW